MAGGLIYFAINGFPGFGPSGNSDAHAAAPTTPTPTVNRFDSARAFALLKSQVAMGQREAGSPTSRKLGLRLRGLLPNGRFETVPGGLRNVVGTLPGTLPAIVIGAHYDSEALPVGFVGANDSAAGTAAVVEVARALSRYRRHGGPQLRFVLFDGEEEPAGSKDSFADGLRGSRAYVLAHPGQVKEMILLDYVANKGLSIPRELQSDVKLWGNLRAAAARVGVASVFPNSTQGGVWDDHTAFADAGIPAIDLIDFSYQYRDTLQDTVDKVCASSLDTVGETVVELIRRR
ncbi:MAG: M28 family metallopeptidase [Solirubrobacterales bacterium]|nr:M28 family metallopeptidase [Solirubrobacterales bacterium]